MCWKLIPDGPYHPFHDLTYASPATALGCFTGKTSIASSAAEDDEAARKWEAGPAWLPVITTVIEALEPFQEASRAVTEALHSKHPEQLL